MLLSLLWILTGLAVAFVLGTLIMGARAMGGKDANARAMSNKWMQRRVMGQFVAIGLLFLTLYVKKGGL